VLFGTLSLSSGPFPRPALPGVRGTTSLSATPPGPACPSRASGWRSRASAELGFPCCRYLPCVDMPLPLPRWDRRVRSLMGRPIPPVSLFADDGGLPRLCDGSAPTFTLSRPAQHSLALRPVDSLHRRAVHGSRRLRRFRYLHRRSDSFRPERTSWPDGTCTRWEDTAFPRRTHNCGLQDARPPAPSPRLLGCRQTILALAGASRSESLARREWGRS